MDEWLRLGGMALILLLTFGTIVVVGTFFENFYKTVDRIEDLHDKYIEEND